MDNSDIHEKTKKTLEIREEQIIESALHSVGYTHEEIDMKLKLLKTKDNLKLRDSIIKEVCDQMKSTTCGFAPNFTYRIVSVVANLSYGTVQQKAQSTKIRKYSNRKAKNNNK